MDKTSLIRLAAGICLPLLIVGLLVTGSDPVLSVAYGEVTDMDVSVPLLNKAASASSRSCLPRYADPKYVLTVNDTAAYEYEPNPTPGDLIGDGLEDVVITKSTFQTYETYELDVLLNDGSGSVVLVTSSVFSGTVPAVQNPRQVVMADFDGDGRSDIFVADHGYDADPFPGYQNILVLTIPGGKLVDATGNLPQQSDFTHSAAAADIDADDDIDLYVGNLWGQNMINPQILLNDGSGKFTVAENRLPPLVDLTQNGYTSCEFVDVNNDGSPDLILGDADDDISNPHSTRTSEVLLNNGSGFFTLLPNGIPAKAFSPFDMVHDIEPLYLNDDAYMDLLVVHEKVNAQGSYIQALINNQDGTFRDETASRMESLDRVVWIPTLELRDMDRDGDLDLLAYPFDDQDPDPILFLNDGNGHFGRKFVDFKLPYLNYTFLDLDRDGGHDLLYITHAPPEDVYAIRDMGCTVFLPLVCAKHPGR